MYKYYRPYTNETNRPDWLVFLDHLIECGRLYTQNSRPNPDYTYLSTDETRRLTSLLFQDNTLSDREEIMCCENRDELSYAIIGYIESNSIDAEKRIVKIISDNIRRNYEPIIEDLFEQIRKEQGIIEHV